MSDKQTLRPWIPKATAKDWPEDFDDENGQYCNRCFYCGELFLGHKRRIICKVCAEKRGAVLSAHKEAEND